MHTVYASGHMVVHEPTFSHFQPFIAQNYWVNFNQNHVLDALQSHYLMYRNNNIVLMCYVHNHV